jgi:hypothetical protein
MKISDMSWQNWEVDESIFSSGASRVTVPDELIEMVQYESGLLSIVMRNDVKGRSSKFPDAGDYHVSSQTRRIS